MAILHPSLFVASLVAFVAGLVYLLVASEFRQRISHVLRESRQPILFFALWWACLGLNILIGGAFYLGASLGYTDFTSQLVYAVIQRLLLSVSLIGLMFYLLYLLTGRGWFTVLAPYYAAYFLFIVYTMYNGEPQGVEVGEWRTDLAYAQPNPPLVGLINFVLLVIPPVAASLAYFFRFIRKAGDRALRYRITLVSWPLAVWWIMAVIAGQREAMGNEEFQLVNRFFGLVVALVILAAYRPPLRLRRWLEGGSVTPATDA
jgi:hypothetical protein